MKAAFATCVKLGLACMEEIYRIGGKLEFVITLKDDQDWNKSGRVYVDDFCSSNRIPVLKVNNINEPVVEREIVNRDIDWLFVIGWSQIVRPPVLWAPKRGAVGIHPTLLPEGRGRAPIPWAILKQLPEAGVTMFLLDEGVDSGPIIAQERLPLAPDETATTLYERVCKAHVTLIQKTWAAFENNQINPIPQDHEKATYWLKRTPEDGRISLDMSVYEVERLVRATTRPYPGAFIDDTHNRVRIRIWAGKLGDPNRAPEKGCLRLFLRDGVYDATEYEREPIDL